MTRGERSLEKLKVSVLIILNNCLLTNKDLSRVLHTVIKHDGHLRTPRKCIKHELQASAFYISQVFSNVQSVLSQCNTV